MDKYFVLAPENAPLTSLKRPFSYTSPGRIILPTNAMGSAVSLTPRAFPRSPLCAASFSLVLNSSLFLGFFFFSSPSRRRLSAFLLSYSCLLTSVSSLCLPPSYKLSDWAALPSAFLFIESLFWNFSLIMLLLRSSLWALYPALTGVYTSFSPLLASITYFHLAGRGYLTSSLNFNSEYLTSLHTDYLVHPYVPEMGGRGL